MEVGSSGGGEVRPEVRKLRPRLTRQNRLRCAESDQWRRRHAVASWARGRVGTLTFRVASGVVISEAGESGGDEWRGVDGDLTASGAVDSIIESELLAQVC